MPETSQDGLENDMVGFNVERVLIAIGFWTVGFALLGAAGIMFVLNNRDDKQDEGATIDETGDELEKDWVNEVLRDINEADDTDSLDDVDLGLDEEQVDDLDEFWKTVMEIADLDEPAEEWCEAPEQETPEQDPEQEDEQDGQQEEPRNYQQETEQSGERDDKRDADETDGETEQVVFATLNGKVWHADKDCPRLRRSKSIKEIKMGEAVADGMKACGVCGK